MTPPGAPGLVALHNITPGKLRKAVDLGGLPMPSLAVLPLGHGFERYGGVTLIAHPALADPASGMGARLFSADVYSPRVPDPEWSVNRRALSALARDLVPEGRRLEVYHDDVEHVAAGGRDRLQECLERSPAAMALWLRAAGHEVPAVPRSPVPFESPLSRAPAVRAFHFARPAADLRSPEFARALRRGFAELRAEPWPGGAERARSAVLDRLEESNFEASGLVCHRALYPLTRDRQTLLEGSTSVDREAFRLAVEAALDAADPGRAAFGAWAESWAGRVCENPSVRAGRRRLPYTAENVLAAMRAMPVQGAEGGLTFSLGLARSAAARAFGSLDEAALRAGAIVPAAGFEAAREALHARFQALAETLSPRYAGGGMSNPFARGMQMLDDLSAAVHDHFRSAARGGPDRLSASLRRNGFHGLGPGEVAAARAFAADLEAMPTEYFEAKLDRLVGLDEFVAAALPEDAPAALESLLARGGVERVARYRDGDRAAVTAVLAREAGAVHGRIPAPPEPEAGPPRPAR